MKSFSDYQNNLFDKNPDLQSEYQADLEEMKINLTLKLLREEAGLTQEQVAARMHRKRPAITRLENHAQDNKLSTIIEYAHACGREIKISFV